MIIPQNYKLACLRRDAAAAAALVTAIIRPRLATSGAAASSWQSVELISSMQTSKEIIIYLSCHFLVREDFKGTIPALPKLPPTCA